MKFISHKSILTVAAALMALPSAARTGAPHSLTANAVFSQVALSWKSPEAPKTLQWHNDDFYNGDSAPVNDERKAVVFWTAADFSADDLVNNVGDVITSVSYGMYYPLVGATVYVYEDGVQVAKADADNSRFAKGKMQAVPLPAPVTIKAGSSYRFAVKHTAGQNNGFVGMKDRGTDAPGKGDLASYDGVTWFRNSGGDYLITANLANSADEAPQSYNILRDGVAVGSTDGATSHTLYGEPAGTHSYSVQAVYGGETLTSGAVTATCVPFAGSPAAPTVLSQTVNGFDVALEWAAPLDASDRLTWGRGEFATAIGGTASTNTKLWVRNDFEAEDLNAFAGATIDAIGLHLADATVTAVTLWIMEDGKIVYHEEADASSLKAGWNRMALSTPFALKECRRYAFGVYLLQTPKTKPISIDNSPSIAGKGNLFSTSSPSTKDFSASSPSWKALTDGGIEGNWLMYAEVSGVNIPDKAPAYTYTVSRDGETLTSGLTALSFSTTVPGPGTYTYGIRAVSGGNTSAAANKTVTVSLPSTYAAPMITDAYFEPELRHVTFVWTADKPLAHCGEARYTAPFDEEMDMMWGTEFSADELKPYAGMQLTSLRYIVGATVKDNLTVGIYRKNGQALWEASMPGHEVTSQAWYSITLDKPVAISGDEPLILAYKAVIPKGSSSMVLDEGPLVDNGARVSFTGGATWLNLGTVNPTYNNYNICISGFVGNTDSDRQLPMRKEFIAKAPVLKAIEGTDRSALRETQVEAAASTPSAVRSRTAAMPQPRSFNIYRNGEKFYNTTATNYDDVPDGFGKYRYTVTAVYENGWESAHSNGVTIDVPVAQKATAPYGLKGETDDSKALKLTWKSPAEAVNLNYIADPAALSKVGITSTNPTTYAMVKFSADDLKPYVGHKVDHIQFALAEDVYSCAVVIAVGENIVYNQEVENPVISSNGVRLNDVRLNEPFVIPADAEVAVGYVVSYPTGGKPLGLTGTCVKAGYSDIISQRASMGYFYSLKTKYKIDANFYINAIIATPEGHLRAKAQRQAPSALTYNVYYQGQPIATGLTEAAYTVTNAGYGTYHVTAVDGDNESGESNTVTLWDPNDPLFPGDAGVSDITADSDNSPEQLYDLQGRRVRGNPAPGIYLRRQGGTTVKQVCR